MAVKSVQAIINGQTYNLTLNSETGKYEATITAPATSSYPQAGHYYPVIVKATDNADNLVEVDDTDETLGTSLRLQVKENVAPVIVITSPTSGQLTSSNKPQITFEVTDNDSGVNQDSIKLQIDNQQVSGVSSSVIEDGYSCTYTPDTALEDGEHTITVNAADNDGNAATPVSITFRVLATAPNLSVTTPANNSYHNAAEVPFSGTTDGATLTVKVGDGEEQPVSVQRHGDLDGGRSQHRDFRGCQRIRRGNRGNPDAVPGYPCAGDPVCDHHAQPCGRWGNLCDRRGGDRLRKVVRGHGGKVGWDRKR